MVLRNGERANTDSERCSSLTEWEMSMANDTANGPSVRLPWAGKWVRIEEVEERLTSLWSMSHDNLRTSGANVNVRTSVLNLVICTPDIETAGLASKVLRDLSSTHLARVAIVVLDSSEPNSSVSAWVTLRCFSMISDLMRHCFEQTTLLARCRAARRARAHRRWRCLAQPDARTAAGSLAERTTRLVALDLTPQQLP